MNRIYATRHGLDITVSINGQIRQVTADDEVEAKSIMQHIIDCKTKDGDPDELLGFVAPSYRTQVGQYLEKDRTGRYYLAGYGNDPLPAALVKRFLEHFKEGYPVEPLVEFWKRCMLNPDKVVREDLFKFAAHFSMPITDSGYFIGYKSVAFVGQKHNEYALLVSRWFIEAVSNGRVDPKTIRVVKADRNDMAKYTYYPEDEVTTALQKRIDDYNHAKTFVRSLEGTDISAYTLEHDEYLHVEEDGTTSVYQKVDPSELISMDNFTFLGTLFEEFNGIADLFAQDEQDTFTDWRTRSMTIKLGSPVKQDRSQCDNDPNVTCSRGLHIGTPQYVSNFCSGAEKYIIACLVDPMNVVAVPKDYDGQKLRCCEYFPYAICEFGNTGLNEIKTPYFENDYSAQSKEVLTAMLETFKAEVNQETGEVSPQERIIRERLVDLRSTETI